MNQRIITGIDPGADADRTTQERTRGTGWATVLLVDGKPPQKLAGGLVVGGPNDFLTAMHPATMWETNSMHYWLNRSTEVVVENFTKQVSAAKIHPLEIVGMVEMYCLIRGVLLTKNMPGARKLVSHDDLKRTGWWPGGAGHADEAQAIRHIISKLLREPHIPTAMLFQPPDAD